MNYSRFVVISFFLISNFLSSLYALTLEQAWYRARNYHPSINAARAAICAAKGQQIQANLFPNPYFNMLQGNVPGFGKYSDNPNAQSSYIIKQLIETGGKRSARSAVAHAKFHESQIAFEINNRELFSQTTLAFFNVAEAISKLRLSKQGIYLSQQTIDSVHHRINAGRASEIDLQIAEIALNDQKLATESIKSELIAAKYTLTRLWNGSENEIEKIVVPKLRDMPLYPVSFYLRKTCNNPELKILLQAQKTFNAQLRLANAKKYPDVTVGLGIEHFYQSSAPKSHNAVVAELGIPIPLFDQNQGNILTAAENYTKSRYEASEKDLLLQSKIANIYQIAYQARLQIHTLKNKILPQSRHTMKLAKEGYMQGKFTYVDLLIAQQKLLENQMRAVNAFFLYCRTWYLLQMTIGNLPHKESV